MNLKYNGLLLFLIVIVEAINGSALNDASTSKVHTSDLPAAHSATEKSSSGNGTATTESLNIIIPNTSEIISAKNSPNIISTSSPQPITDATQTTTSSQAPVTKPTPAPSPTPAPTPAPAPAPTPTPAPALEKGSWVVYSKNNKTICIIAEMAMQLNITYPGKDKVGNSVVINIPKEANGSGECSDSLQTLNIAWGPGHNLQINFKTNKSLNNFYIDGLSLLVNASVFNVNESWSFVNKSSEFMTPLDMSYKCSKAQEIELKNENPSFKAVLTLKDTQFEAYMNKTKTEFGAAQDCETFDTPDIVPIAVGCALAILVIVVLVAYLIGRKRSLNRGYLSM